MSERPYADAEKLYAAAGWTAIPVTGKFPPVAGATGREGVADAAKRKAWRKTHAGHNIAIRHEGTIALDVDEYGDKHGADELAELERLHGPLPPTFTSTARGRKTASRQHLYRIPEGVELRAQPSPSIEVVQRHHRYSVGPPSRHPDTGKLYRWYTPTGERFDGVPKVDDLPMLPEAWVDALRAEPAKRDEAADWETIVQDAGEGAPTADLAAALQAAHEAVYVGHSVFRDLSQRVMHLAWEGHRGAGVVLDELRTMHLEYLLSKGTTGRKANSEIERLLKGAAENAAGNPKPTTFPLDAPTVAPVTLDECDDAFRAWLGLEYDLDALHAVLAVAVGEKLTGDPAWLLLLSGSGNAKTETVGALGGAGARLVSSISSAGALLSATSRNERTKDATGGLLREVGERGLLVVKDVTTILSMDRTARAEVLAALREVYDGRWVRNVGTDGGRSLEWSGRLVVIGAVTSAWDRAHDVIASMGDRFVLVRMDSSTGRLAAGRRAISNTGNETTMRAELAAAAAGVLAGANLTAVEPDDEEAATILAAADVVTRARTAVEMDYRGNVVDSHAAEMPTRFAKQLAQVFRGAVAIGLDRQAALSLAIRCARDSMPPLRLEILEDVAAHDWTPLREVTKRVDKPRSTVDRQLQALHLLGLLTVEEDITVTGMSLRETTTWRYTLAPGIDLSCLTTIPNKKGTKP